VLDDSGVDAFHIEDDYAEATGKYMKTAPWDSTDFRD